MKTHALYIAGLVGTAILIYILWTDRQQAKKDVRNYQGIVREQQAEITYRTDKEGRIIADKLAAEANAKQLQEAYPALANAIMKEMDIKLKNVKAVIQAEIRSQGSGVGFIVRDTIFQPGANVSVRDSVYAKDKYMDFRGQIDGSRLTWKYTYQDSLIFAMHTKKRWLFGKEDLYVSGRLSNPGAKVTRQTAIRMDNYRDKRFTVGPAVLYDPFNNKFSVGVSVGFALIKF